MTAFNKQRPRPKWLDRTPTNKNTQRGQRYYRHLWNAQPDWADVKAIREIYARARRMRAAGLDVEVDHVYPLQNDRFCGLHVHQNLEIVDRRLNVWKSNRRHRNHPQLELFEECDPFWRLKPARGTVNEHKTNMRLSR